MENIKNKIIIITGASKGIGRTTANKLAKAGAKLILNSRKISDLQKLEKELGASDYLLIEGDVSNEKTCIRLVDESIKKYGRVDVLINNAAQFAFGKVVDLSLEDFDRVINTNLRAPFILSKLVIPHMIKQDGGTILNISSTSGKRGHEGGSLYAASKFALNGLSECLLKEVRQHNIRIITISPSMVDTKIKPDEEIKSSGKGVYMRMEDVADSILYALNLPQRALIKDIEIWGTNP
ncbi:MAG: SDR family oxidoreductase [Ignavibacteria bacterium]|nr:SDR family oxidoreductase [Ignavibacteria bacterium]